jgi:hypothetical protein
MSWIIIIIIIRIFRLASKYFPRTTSEGHVIYLPGHENTRAIQSHISFPKMPVSSQIEIAAPPAVVREKVFFVIDSHPIEYSD